MNTNFTQEEQNDIINMYQNNVSIDDIIDKYHCEEKYIRNILKENEIDRKYHTFQNELYQRIIKLYQDGFTYNQITEQLLIHEPVIRKTLKKNNIKTRSYSDNNRRYYRNQHYFDEINTPNKAYVLGILFADGCNHIEHNAITISLQEEDIDTLRAIKNELSYGGPIRENNLNDKNPNWKNQRILVINDQYLSQRLEELGIVNNKSLIVKHPDYLSNELIPHFIRGYFDGDGCICNMDKFKDTSLSIVGTVDMCQWIENFILSNNISCYYDKSADKRCNKNTKVLRISGVLNSYKFLSLIYNNSELKMYRKYQKYLYMCDNYLTERNLICLNETNK